jgi:hypothetical protein
MTTATKTISGAELKLHLRGFIEGLADDDKVFFGSGDLSFYRLKERGPVEGPRLVQFAFNEVYTVVADPDAL